jgi:hypothetical protein
MSSRDWKEAWRRAAAIAVLTAGVAAVGPAARAQTADLPPPSTDRTDDPPPVALFSRRVLHQPPAIDASLPSVQAFVAWASASVPDEREDARAAIRRAARNPVLSRTTAVHLCRLVERSLKTDHTLALVQLAILGELRNDGPGAHCLGQVAWAPVPTEGTFDEERGDLLEAESLETLQAKAIDGLAYLRSAGGDAEVLRAVAFHPSRIVRAEAIDAYLWNHGDSEAAKARLRALTREHGEEVFVDRIRREDGEGAATFDPKLEAFLRAHPELEPAEDQEGGANPPKEERGGSSTPPPVDGFVFGPTCGATAPACNGTCDAGRTCVADPDAGCICAPSAPR